jgi:hypothetical protein
MTELEEKKRKFIEHLLTLGALLAVFLGLVTTSTDLIRLLIYFGTLFVITSLLSYAALLFGVKTPETRWTKLMVRSSNLLLAGSFGGIILIAFVDAFQGSGAGSIVVAIAVLGAIYAVSILIYLLVAKLLNLEEPKSTDGKAPE